MLASALLTAYRVLQSDGDPRAPQRLADLLRRLDLQLSTLPEAEDRERLLQCVTTWRDIRALSNASS